MSASNEPWWKRASGWIKKQYEPLGQAVGPAVCSADTTFDLIPGQLSVVVRRLELPTQTTTIPCWTYVTNGLQRYQQPEIAFTLFRQRHETVAPEEPLGLMR